MNIEDKLIEWRKSDKTGGTQGIEELRKYADKLIEAQAPKIIKIEEMLEDYRTLIKRYNDVSTIAALRKNLINNIATVIDYKLEKMSEYDDGIDAIRKFIAELLDPNK